MMAALQQPQLVAQQPTKPLLLCSLGQKGRGGRSRIWSASPSPGPACSLGFAKAAASLGKKLSCAKQLCLLLKQYVQSPLTLQTFRIGRLGVYFSCSPLLHRPVFSLSPSISEKKCSVSLPQPAESNRGAAPRTQSEACAIVP